MKALKIPLLPRRARRRAVAAAVVPLLAMGATTGGLLAGTPGTAAAAVPGSCPGTWSCMYAGPGYSLLEGITQSSNWYWGKWPAPVTDCTKWATWNDCAMSLADNESYANYYWWNTNCAHTGSLYIGLGPGTEDPTLGGWNTEISSNSYVYPHSCMGVGT